MGTIVDTSKDISMSGTHSGTVPNCRLFILGGRDLDEEQWKQKFSKYGTIEHVVIHKDKKTDEPKGVCYITYAKASEAFLAQEAMDRQMVAGDAKPIKVNIASDKREGNKKDENEGRFHRCICVKVALSATEKQVKEDFSQYGEIDMVNLMTPRTRYTAEDTLAFVRYVRAYSAALAVENCDPSYKAMFADNKPKPHKRQRDWEEDRFRGPPDLDRFGGPRGREEDRFRGPPDLDRFGGPRGPPGPPGMDRFGPRGPPDLPPPPIAPPLPPLPPKKPDTCLEVMTTDLPDPLFRRLFDLIPGFDYCEIDQRTGIALVRYVTPDAAAYAKERLSGFEYPPGQKLGVRFAPKSRQILPDMDSIARKLKHCQAEVAAVGRLHGDDPNIDRFVQYTDIPLPKPQLMAPKTAKCKERLFIVCMPKPIPYDILVDAFCRFGNLIEIYLIKEKNFGYARYADKDSARRASEAINGKRLCNSNMKAVVAEKSENEDGEGGVEADHEEAERNKRIKIEEM